MASVTDVVGYAYEADVYCVDCALVWFCEKLRNEAEAIDDEGSPVSPIFLGDDAYEECPKQCAEGRCRCDDCGDEHDCAECDGTGTVSRRCGDCGEKLVE